MKKISFDRPTIFYFRQSQDEIEYRKPFWEIIARDRERFRHRINSVEVNLEKYLIKHLNSDKNIKRKK